MAKIDYTPPYNENRIVTVTTRLTPSEKKILLDLVAANSGHYSWQRPSQSDVIMYALTLLKQEQQRESEAIARGSEYLGNGWEKDADGCVINIL